MFITCIFVDLTARICADLLPDAYKDLCSSTGCSYLRKSAVFNLRLSAGNVYPLHLPEMFLSALTCYSNCVHLREMFLSETTPYLKAVSIKSQALLLSVILGTSGCLPTLPLLFYHQYQLLIRNLLLHLPV